MNNQIQINREKNVDEIIDQFNEEIKKKIFTSKFRESRNGKNNLTFFGKKESLKLIQNKTFVDLKDNKIKKLNNIKLST